MTAFAHLVRAMLRATSEGPFAEDARTDVDGHQGSWPGVTDDEWRVAQHLGQRIGLVLPDRAPQ